MMSVGENFNWEIQTKDGKKTGRNYKKKKTDLLKA